MTSIRVYLTTHRWTKTELSIKAYRTASQLGLSAELLTHSVPVILSCCNLTKQQLECQRTGGLCRLDGFNVILDPWNFKELVATDVDGFRGFISLELNSSKLPSVVEPNRIQGFLRDGHDEGGWYDKRKEEPEGRTSSPAGLNIAAVHQT